MIIIYQLFSIVNTLDYFFSFFTFHHKKAAHSFAFIGRARAVFLRFYLFLPSLSFALCFSMMFVFVCYNYGRHRDLIKFREVTLAKKYKTAPHILSHDLKRFFCFVYFSIVLKDNRKNTYFVYYKFANILRKFSTFFVTLTRFKNCNLKKFLKKYIRIKTANKRANKKLL